MKVKSTTASKNTRKPISLTNKIKNSSKEKLSFYLTAFLMINFLFVILNLNDVSSQDYGGGDGGGYSEPYYPGGSSCTSDPNLVTWYLPLCPVQSCGFCGTQAYKCDTIYGWDYSQTTCYWTVCSNVGECSANSVQTESCIDGGVRFRPCSSACTFGNWSNCIGMGQCNSGEIQEDYCGVGGTKARACQSNFQWGPWSDCQNEIPHQDIESATYYCASDRTFTQDLDSKDQESCNKANHTWTGSKCCSEDDDILEYYNDPSGIGGCWNKTAILSGSFVKNTKNIVNANGNFLGCNILDAGLLQIKDSHKNYNLINNTLLCFQDDYKFYLCNEDNEWVFSNGKDRSKLSPILPSLSSTQEKQFACCSQTECWNGSICVPNQAAKPLQGNYQQHRCIDGNWIFSELKSTPFGDAFGFCPKAKQCLVSPFGNTLDNEMPDKNPQCIIDGQYIGDDYCERGNWTSRTKFLASALLDSAKIEQDFVLFCDKAENVLNEKDHVIGTKNIGAILKGAAYHFCTISYNGKVIVGTAIEKKMFSQLIEISALASCFSLPPSDTAFRSCDSSNAVWYNPSLAILVYSTTPFSMAQDSALQAFFSVIKSPIDSLRYAVSVLRNEPLLTLEHISRFDRLYLSKHGTKSIQGVIEGFQDLNLLIEYRGFESTPICASVEEYAFKFNDTASNLRCQQLNGTYFVTAEGSFLTGINPDELWDDLTAKIRIS